MLIYKKLVSFLKFILPKYFYEKIRKILLTVIYNVLYVKYNVFAFFQKKKLTPFSKFNKLKRYHNIHKNKRCFIVATGPSLTINDLEKLNNEITFSMNSIILSFKDTTWRPTYYGIQDYQAYEKLLNNVNFENLLNEVKTIFIGDWIIKRISKINLPKIYNSYPLNLYRHILEETRDYTKLKFSDDVSAVVYDGFTITYSLLQIAAYMGFTEIYLLGCDCNYEIDKINHFVDYGTELDYKNLPDLSICGKSMTCAYATAKKYSDAHGIKIYNATRGGKLEVFERVDFDSLFI